MNNKKINIIHPKDSSTDFLASIHSYIKNHTSLEINLLRLKSKDDHLAFFEDITAIPNDELIFFIGHGTSMGLSGAMTKEYELPEFITLKQLKVFENKNIILLSCRSNQYLKMYFDEANLKSAIGFPNLITDYEEIKYHDDPSRFEDVSNKDIENFRNLIVDVMKYSIEDFANNDLSFADLFNRIKLRINKRIINLYSLKPNNGKLPLGKMMNDMVEGLYFGVRF